MNTGSLEWVEIIEPRTRSSMFANLTTGQCVWEPPEDVKVKKFDANQWWELFDPNTNRCYYYNATSLKTVWHKPQNCDIIPLAKLQQIKQNTEVATSQSGTRDHSLSAQQDQKRSGLSLHNIYYNMTSSTTQTSPAPSPRASRRASNVGRSHHNSGGAAHGSHRCSHRMSTESNGSVADELDRRLRRPSQSSQSSAVSGKGHRESGRLSDSSIPQSKTSGDGCSHRSRAKYERSRKTGCNHPVRSPCSPTPSQSPSPPSFHPSLNKQRSFDVSLPIREVPLSRSHSFMARPTRLGNEGDLSALKNIESTPQPLRRHRAGCSSTGVEPHYSNGLAHLISPGRQRSSSSCLEGLATPMSHRKQRSMEGLKLHRLRISPQPTVCTAVHSDSSPSPPSPRRRSFSPFVFDSPKCPDSGTSTLTDHGCPTIRGSADSSPHSQLDSGLVSGTTGSRGSQDSGAPSLNRIHSHSDDHHRHSHSRCSHHRSRHHQCSKHRGQGASNITASLTGGSAGRPPTYSSGPCSPLASQRSLKGGVGDQKQVPAVNNLPMTDSDRSDTLQSSTSPSQNNRNSSSNSSSVTAKRYSGSSPNENVSCTHRTCGNSPAVSNQKGTPTNTKSGHSNGHQDITHLYSNLDYIYDQPVYQYIIEQAKLSGYRLQKRELGDDDSLHSNDSDRFSEDSDEFADDEGMSNADSSSQECLEEINYLPDDETYTQFFMPSHQRKHRLPDYSKDLPADPSRLHPPVGLLSNTSSGSVVDGHPHSYNSSSANAFGLHAGQVGNNDSSLSSLRRKKEMAPQPPKSSPTTDARASVQSFNTPRTISVAPSSHSESGADTPGGPLMEMYAQENLNVHTKGLLRKKVPVMDMISWTKDPIRKPMLTTVEKGLKNQACEMFKLIQIYMSDRKPKPGMTLNSVGLDIVLHAFSNPGLRDELFVQICRQTTENHKRDSLRRGWELMSICLEFFPPSDKFAPYLSGYISRHCDPAYQAMFPEVSKWPIHIQINHYAGICCKRLIRTTENIKRQRIKKPNLEAIDLARLHIFRASMFGGTLEEVLALQGERYPHRRLPWVQTTLSEEVLRLQGTNTEGIFRVPADFDEVNHLKQVVDQWEVGECGDPHVVAALLKLWYRELFDPLIPDHLYGAAVLGCESPSQSVMLINQLPDCNRMVLSYLIRFLQYFSQAEIVSSTKMDASNLAMVFAPNVLRCTSEDPKVIYENSRKEMAFMRTLIQNFDTAFMEGVV